MPSWRRKGLLYLCFLECDGLSFGEEFLMTSKVADTAQKPELSTRYTSGKRCISPTQPYKIRIVAMFKVITYKQFIHSVVCLRTGPKPLPKPALHIVRSRASPFKWEYPLLSLRSSSSFLVFFVFLSLISPLLSFLQ
jgi:hypothetical protein